MLLLGASINISLSNISAPSLIVRAALGLALLTALPALAPLKLFITILVLVFATLHWVTMRIRLATLRITASILAPIYQVDNIMVITSLRIVY